MYWPLKMATILCPKMLATNYISTLCNTPKEQRSHLHCGRSLELPNVHEIAYMLSGSMSLEKYVILFETSVVQSLAETIKLWISLWKML